MQDRFAALLAFSYQPGSTPYTEMLSLLSGREITAFWTNPVFI
jgi:hypothetical protein